MRILYFIDSLAAGGKERRLIELLKGIKSKTNIEFELVLMNNDIHYKEVFDLNINIHYILRKTKKDISVFYKFYKLCRNYRPDIIHCWDSMTAVYLIPTCQLLQIKLVNGLVVNSPVKQNIYNKSWLRAKLTFPFSNIIVGNSKAGLIAYKAPKNKSVVIYNGFNFERIKIMLKSNVIREQLDLNQKYVIGMVATFSKYKDYTTYFNAAQLLLRKRNDITFLAIGSNTDSILVKSLIDNKYIEHFRLLGIKTDIESYINAMDICVLSTFTEGISNSILEYMALKKPVIATSGGGTNEIVEDNKTGFLIKTADAEDLSNKMELLLSNVKLRNKMGLAGQEKVNEIFSIDCMTNKYISLYEKLLTNI